MEREGEKGGGGEGWRWASMSDHVGDGTWTITFTPWIFSNVLIAVHIISQNLISIHSYHIDSLTVARKKSKACNNIKIWLR